MDASTSTIQSYFMLSIYLDVWHVYIEQNNPNIQINLFIKDFI
jgi:hypothetical protein